MKVGRLLLIACALLVEAGVARADDRTIGVFVALCDNEHQGIVPVSAKLDK